MSSDRYAVPESEDYEPDSNNTVKDMINYALIDRTTSPDGYKEYITSIHEGFSGDYERIKQIFLRLLKQSN